ncbi:hypothetical protein [Actinokineospora enzanensis]|uniref:hypothetical protein n=1 Tax=Actinokineospora enzanensis TaxID=155975 RepID=UPI00037FEF35|nr:hypothetical protein [Actinokineospora enzanensis]
MRNELYIVWLVKSSQRARAVVGEVLGNFALQDLLRRLSRFDQTEERYAEMAIRVQAAFTPPRLPTVFTAQHLRMLVDPKAQPVLAEVLDCPHTDTIAALLDADQLARALREAGHTKDGIGDAELLLLDLMARLPRLAARHGLEARDWGGFIERRAWLTPSAVRKLTEAAHRWEWPEAQPTQILAGVLEGVSRQRETGPAERFDTLALIELRRRVGLLAEQLRSNAVEHAEEAAVIAPELGSVRRLPAWIELYELHQPAVGMRRLFTGATTLGHMLRGAHAEPPPVTGEPQPEEGLHVTNDIAFGVFKRRIAFDITCAIQGQPHPQVILRCRGLRREEYNAIRDTVQRLRGADLSTSGSTLGERLLNTEVAQQEGLRGHLRLALQEHGSAATQCLVLTGMRQPVEVTPPWHEHLATQLPYEAPPTGDSTFPPLTHVTDALRATIRPGRRVEEV